MITQHFIQTTNKFDFNFNNPLHFIDYVISFLPSILWNLLIKSIALFMAMYCTTKKKMLKKKIFRESKEKERRRKRNDSNC